MQGRLFSTLCAALVAVMTAGGCTGSVGNKAAGGSPSMPAARPSPPPEFACYSLGGDPGNASTLPASVDCAGLHTMETVHVGTFVGADQAEPPPAGGPTRRQAYQDCFASAKEFLGDDYRVAPLALSVAVPVESDWTAGARWFRCDLAYLDYDQIQPRPGSLRGALAGAKPMLLRCLKAASTATRVDFNGSVPCTTPHEIEFAGIYDAPDGPYPTDEKGRRRMIETGCRGVVAAFAGVPDDAQLPRRTSWVYGDIPETQWQLGNRGVPCYVAPRAPVSRSLQDAGPRALPAR